MRLNDVYNIDIGSIKPCFERFNANERHCDQSIEFIPKDSIGDAIDFLV
jgi:hypothetical protein